MWSGLDVLVRQGTQFVVMVALARLLSPEQFGIVAVMTLLTVLGTVLVDGGFGAAIIQSPRRSPRAESSVFYLNIAIGVTITAAIAGLAPIVASFYSMPELRQIAPVMGLSVAISSLGTVPVATLTRDLRIRPIMVAGAAGSIASGTCAIWLAASGYGIWALAWQPVILASVQVSTIWLARSWRPLLVIDLSEAKQLLRFGGYVFAANALDALYARSYTVALGRFYTPASVGLYNRADAAQQFSVGLISGALSRITMPALRRHTGDRLRMRGVVRRMLRSTMLINVPAMMLLAAFSAQIMELMYGSAWSEAATPFAILCLAGMFWPLHVLNLQVIMTLGLGRDFLTIELAKKSVGIVLLALGATVGITGIACGALLFSVVAFALNTIWVSREIQYTLADQVRDCAGTFLLAAPFAIGSFIAGHVWSGRPLIVVIAGLAASVAGYSAIAWRFSIVDFRETIALLKGRGSD